MKSIFKGTSHELYHSAHLIPVLMEEFEKG
jgi:hypothetical protein